MNIIDKETGNIEYVPYEQYEAVKEELRIANENYVQLLETVSSLIDEITGNLESTKKDLTRIAND